MFGSIRKFLCEHSRTLCITCNCITLMCRLKEQDKNRVKRECFFPLCSGSLSLVQIKTVFIAVRVLISVNM